jgi:hypothetical protein
VQQQIENRRLKNRLGQEMLARRRGSGDGENARADDRSHAQCDQAPNAQRFFQLPVGLFGSRDQSIDAFGAKELVHRRSASSLSLPLALRHMLHFFLLGAASDTRCPLGLGGRFLAGCALYFLALRSVFNILSVHSC